MNYAISIPGLCCILTEIVQQMDDSILICVRIIIPGLLFDEDGVYIHTRSDGSLFNQAHLRSMRKVPRVL